MSNVVIVAIPDENDRVWKVSSEKVPHLTLLFLGDENEVSNLDQIIQFVEHAASQTLKRFYLPVDRRGELGEDKADVLFFKKGRYDYKAVRDFRATLLQDSNIKTANDSAQQHEGPWLPHLTLGYPATPAKPDATDRDFGFYDVGFNKIAIWTSDFEGPEFLLKDYWDDFDIGELPMDVAMSDIARPVTKLESIETTQTADLGAEFLAHYGVKGMHWGQRKSPPEAVPVSAMSHVPQRTKGKTKIKVEGGENHPAHEDAIKVARAQAKLKKSGTAALSNKELQELQNRLNLERNVTQLVGSTTRVGKGRNFVKGLTGFNKEVNDTVNTGFQTARLSKQKI